MKRHSRLKKGRARLVSVSVRLSGAEHRILVGMAQRAGQSINAFVRSVLATHSKIEAEVLRQQAESTALRERQLISAAVERKDERAPIDPVDPGRPVFKDGAQEQAA